MKANKCKHCAAVDKHFSFQCHTQRKPIQPKVGDEFGSMRAVKIQPSWENKPLVTKKQKAIPVFSEKHKKLLAEYRIVRDQYMRGHTLCDARLYGCSNYATDLHHKCGRTGKLLTDVRYFMAVCRSCHNAIEREPEMAKEKGFSLTRTDK